MSDRNISSELVDTVVPPHNELSDQSTRHQGRLFRTLLLRRHVDPILLSAGMAAFAVKLHLDMIVFAYFIGTGVYFLAFRHRISQRVDPDYRFWCLIYVGYAVAVGLLLHGNLPKEIRWIGYPVYLLSGMLLMVGFALVKDPLRQIVLGARIATVIALPLAIVELLTGDMRIGFGGNEANTAFVLIVISLLARHRVDAAPKYLPDSSLWFYLGAIVVFMTGTRSVLPVVLMAIAFDIFRILLARKKGQTLLTRQHRSAIIASGIALVVVGTIAGAKMSSSLADRFDYTVLEIQDAMGEVPEQQPMTGLGVRLRLWKNALATIAEHPLAGVGGVESMRQVKSMIPPQFSDTFSHFVHVHDFVLDELRQRGLVGLILMLAFFVVVSRKIWKGGDASVRETLTLMLLSLICYGSLHGLMLSDRNVLLISIVLAALLLEAHRHGKIGVRTRLINP